jgi:hypothetical protein
MLYSGVLGRIGNGIHGHSDAVFDYVQQHPHLFTNETYLALLDEANALDAPREAAYALAVEEAKAAMELRIKN